jgi:hypothetical protein
MRLASGRRRYGLLLLCVLVALFVQGVARPTAVQQLVVSALSGTILLLALRAADMARRWARIAAALAVAVFVLTLVRVTAGGIDEGAARAMNAALVAFGPPVVAIGVLRELRSSEQVQLQAVMGVLSLYILLGMLFAFTFGAIDKLGGAPFFTDGAPATVAHCVYFSFVTLATVGYGDFAARSDLGHTLAVFEALLGQIYLVTVVSLIVSNLGRPSRRREPASDEEQATHKEEDSHVAAHP